MHLSEPLKDTMGFFASGGSICPFATKAARGRGVIAMQATDDMDDLTRAIAAFGVGAPGPHRLQAGPLALVVASSVQASDHATAEPAATELYGSLWVASASLRQAVSGRAAAALRKRAIAVLGQDGPGPVPVLQVHGKPCFVIAMSPAYPRHHPRFAPAVCAVVTWQEDVAVQSPAKIEQIRERMAATTGDVYDANTYYLPPSGWA